MNIRPLKFTTSSILILIFLFLQTMIVHAQEQIRPNLAGGTTWYVSTVGSNSNDCLTVSTPCLTINGAIGKAVDGDAIYVGAGTYMGTGTEVVLIDKSITLSGGWDILYGSIKHIHYRRK